MNKLFKACAAIGIIIILIGCISPSKTNHTLTESPTVSATAQEAGKPDEKEKEIVEKNTYHPIVIGSVFMGGSLDGIWKGSDEVAKEIKGNEEYSLYSLNQYLGTAPGSSIYYSDASGCELVNIEYDKDSTSNVIGVQADWNPMPRKSTFNDFKNEDYMFVIAEILKGYGLKDIPIIIKQVIKTDLDDDGTDEIIISAENITAYVKNENGEIAEPDFSKCEPNTYSIVVLLKTMNDETKTIELSKSLYIDQEQIQYDCPTINNITSVIDLNGDGKMEIVIGYSYYEGYGYYIYEIKDYEASLIYSNGDGL